MVNESRFSASPLIGRVPPSVASGPWRETLVGAAMDYRPAQRAKLIAKRKAAYEAVHPETKHGGSRRGSSRQVGNSNGRFTAGTAAKSGRSRTAVARDATRAKALGPDLDRVARTSRDKGAELDALACDRRS